MTSLNPGYQPPFGRAFLAALFGLLLSAVPLRGGCAPATLDNLGSGHALPVGAAIPVAIPVAVPPGVTLVIADDANHLKTLMQASGEQAKLAAKVDYANFSSGPLRLEAIRAGAAQLGAVGDVPPILAEFAGAHVVVVGAVITAGTGFLPATAPHSGIHGFADLKGKKVAINEGTAQQAILLRDLDSVGLGIQDVQIVKLGLSEFADALRADQIDAAVLKQPDLARYLLSTRHLGATELANAPNANTGLTYLYASERALDDPAQAAAIRDFLIHWYRASLWENTHTETWRQVYYIQDQHLKAEDAQAAQESEGQISIPHLTDALISRQQRTIALLQAAGTFAGKSLDARHEFDLRFADLDQNAATSK